MINHGQTPEHGQPPEHGQVEAALLRLKVRRDNATLNAYLAALVSGGWTKVVLGQMLSVSHQAVAQRIKSALSSTAAVDIGDLPIPAPPPGRRYAVTTHTKSGLPVPDTAAITAAAEKRARASITAISGGTPLQQLAALGDFVDTSAAQLRDLEGEREDLAWSLTCFERQRDLTRGGGWERRAFHERRLQVLGVSSEQLKAMTDEELKDLAKARGIKHRDNALSRYAQVASDIVAAAAVTKIAETARDALVPTVVTRNDETGRNQNVIAAAEAIHRSPTAIWQILRKAGRGPDPREA